MIGDDDFAKIEIRSLRVVYSYLNPKDLKKAKRLVQDNQDLLERQRDAFFDQQ